MNDKYLRDLIMNFLIAGRDTTAQALSWCLYLLCEHPDIQDKVYDEIVSVCGRWDSSIEITYDMVSNIGLFIYYIHTCQLAIWQYKLKLYLKYNL